MKKVLGLLLGVLLLGAILVFALLLGFDHVLFAPTKQELAERDLSNLQSALKLFHKRNQRYPSTGEGLQQLVDLHYVEQLPRDPWGNPYGYALQAGGPVVWSHGADGAPGGEGPDADISNSEPGSHQ